MWQAWELKLGYCLVYNSKPFFPVKCLWFCQSFLILNSSLASVSSLGAIPILRLYIFGIFGPTHLPYQHRYSTDVRKNGHILDPPTQTFCWRYIGMASYTDIVKSKLWGDVMSFSGRVKVAVVNVEFPAQIYKIKQFFFVSMGIC